MKKGIDNRNEKEYNQLRQIEFDVIKMRRFNR